MHVKVFQNIPDRDLEGVVQEWISSTSKFQLIQATQPASYPGHVTLTLFYYPVP